MAKKLVKKPGKAAALKKALGGTWRYFRKPMDVVLASGATVHIKAGKQSVSPELGELPTILNNSEPV